MSDGIVSAIRDVGSNWKLVQITAAISPGSSGGPVADRTGRVIGMSRMYLEEGQNLNFAVAGEDIAQILQEELRHPSPRLPTLTNPLSVETIGTETAIADRARQSRKAKQYEDAARILSGSLEKYPNSIRLRVELAETSWGQKDFTASEKYVGQIIDRDPNHPAAHQMLSALYSRTGRWEDAKLEANKAIELGADDEYRSYAHSVLVAVSLAADDVSSALFHLDETARYAENLLEPSYQLVRAIVLVRLERTQEASQAAEKAISLAPKDEQLRSQLRQLGLPRYVMVESHNGQWDGLGNFIVKGVARNVAQRSQSAVKIMAEALDSNGTVVGTGSSYVAPTSIAPGMTGSFAIYIKGNPKRGSKYRVFAVPD